MRRLLIVDDEPLVCVGLRSMLNWDELDIEIIGTARNGQEALDVIEQRHPDIVITDIKMPVMNGLELAEKCVQRYGSLPLFIVLTSYDEFELARRALQTQVVVDYLVKLELTAEALRTAVEKATDLIAKLNRQEDEATAASRRGMFALQEKFFLWLYNNLFETDEQYGILMAEAGITFPPGSYTVALCEIAPVAQAPIPEEKRAVLYSSAQQLAREALSGVYHCYVTALDTGHFCITLCLEPGHRNEQQSFLKDTLVKMNDMIRNYLNVSLRISVGHGVDEPRNLIESYLEAKRVQPDLSVSRPILFGDKRQGYRQQLVLKIQSYIRAHLQSPLPLNSVAAEFNLSPSYLSRLFARTARVSYIEYVTQARIAAAKEMLAQDELRVYEIAEKLSFGNAFYFSKVFKKSEGMSPREYIKALHGKTDADADADNDADADGVDTV